MLPSRLASIQRCRGTSSGTIWPNRSYSLTRFNVKHFFFPTANLFPWSLCQMFEHAIASIILEVQIKSRKWVARCDSLIEGVRQRLHGVDRHQAVVSWGEHGAFPRVPRPRVLHHQQVVLFEPQLLFVVLVLLAPSEQCLGEEGTYRRRAGTVPWVSISAFIKLTALRRRPCSTLASAPLFSH